jgi:hypothetical protein
VRLERMLDAIADARHRGKVEDNVNVTDAV